MDRRSLIKRAGIAGVLAAGVAPAVHAQPVVRWRLASSFPKSLDTIHGSADVFAKALKDMSGGKFEVSVHAAGEQMPAFGVVDGVQNGTVEVAHTAPYYFFGKNEAFAIGGAIPFGMNSRQLTAWMVDGNGGKLMREFYAKNNIVNFLGGNTGAQMGGWFRKEIKTPADLKGLKIRTMENPVHLATFRGMGANPTPMPFGELFSALQQKTIDGQENPSTSNFLQKFYEVQKFSTLSNHFYSPFVFMYSKKIWDTYPKEDQDLILKAAREAGLYQRKINRDTMGDAVAGMEKAGMTVTRLTPEQHQAFMDATKEIAPQFEADLGVDNVKAIRAEIEKAVAAKAAK